MTSNTETIYSKNKILYSVASSHFPNKIASYLKSKLLKQVKSLSEITTDHLNLNIINKPDKQKHELPKQKFTSIFWVLS